MAYGRRRRESHEKDMGSYVKFAWNDAMEIASFIDEEIGALKARKLYESITEESLLKFEKSNQDGIADFIQRSISQRPVYLRKFLKNVKPENVEFTKVGFLVLALIGCLRAKDVIELRDRFRYVLAPGSGNRMTTAGLYAFAGEISNIFEYTFPDEPFTAQGIYMFDDDEDDDDAEQ
ncbi:hypothetical protein ACLBWT_18820 [Paenibacillus sp. D51F]